MTRARHVSEARRRDAATQGGRRMIARGDRPLYRVRMTEDGGWTIDGCPWLAGTAAGRREALAAAREAVAAMLDVAPDRFDVTSDA
jgi:hypothetical protein